MKLCFRNTATGSLLSEIDTGSQVGRHAARDVVHCAHDSDAQICNLLWSRNSNELVSTHGFSAGHAQNQGALSHHHRSTTKH